MKDVELAKFIIPKTELAKLDKKQSKRLVMFSFVIRDLDLLQKILIYIGNGEPETEPERAAKNSLLFFFLKTLISKINEMWDFLQKNKILNGLDDLSVDDVNVFYSDKKTEEIFGFIRDKFGFHYEYQNDVDKPILDALNKLDYFEAWLSTKDSGNEIFQSANSSVLLVIFEKMRELGFEGDDNTLMKTLFGLVLRGG